MSDVMTKLGFHVASASRNGAGDLLKAGARLVVMLDQNMISEANHAGAVTIFRTQQGKGLDNPPGAVDMNYADMPRVAASWMASLIPIWSKNPGAKYYALNNEWDITATTSGMLLNLFTLECMKIAEAAGYPLCIFNWAEGNPSDDPVADGTPLSMEERLVTVLPALAHAVAAGHIIGLHVHADKSNDLQATGEHIALRHERFFRFCETYGMIPTVAITELSNGVGGVEPSLGKYLQAIAWWDQQVRSSKYADHILGGALYGFNAAETLSPAVPQLVKLMRKMPSPSPSPVIDPVVTFRGTCLQTRFTEIVEHVTRIGGTIERLT